MVADGLNKRVCHEGGLLGLSVFGCICSNATLGDGLRAGVVGSVALGVRGSEEACEAGSAGAFEGVLDFTEAVAGFLLSENALNRCGSGKGGRRDGVGLLSKKGFTECFCLGFELQPLGVIFLDVGDDGGEGE